MRDGFLGGLPLLSFWVSLFVGLAATPLVRRLALRSGAVIRPNSHSVHDVPVPHLGALSLYAGLILGIFAGLRSGSFDADQMITRTHLAGMLAGGAFIVALGICDDVRPLSAGVKFVGQVVGATIAVMGFGIRIEFITNPLGGLMMLGAAAVPLTVLWIVSSVNVVNLIDGLDGLAAGVIAIASFALLVVALMSGQTSVVTATAALAGSTLGFLPYNFNPARIFMGDAGAMLLGYCIACVAALGVMKSAAAIALAVPCLALGFPIFDTAFAIVRRAASGRPIYAADRAHIHHRLLERGWSQKRVVLSLYGVSAVLGVSSVALAALGPRYGLLAVAVSVAALLRAGKVLGVFSSGGQGRSKRK